MTIQEIKNVYAKDQGFKYWSDFQINVLTEYDYIEEHYNNIINIIQKECLKVASENAKTIKNGNTGSWYDAGVNKESITNENNIIK